MVEQRNDSLAPVPEADPVSASQVSEVRDLRLRRRLALLAAVVVPLAAVYLYQVPPVEGAWYPKCMFFALTGCHCPGCGTTRCLHALLHGDLRQAVAYNLLTVVSLPFLLVWGLRAGLAAVRGVPLSGPRAPAWCLRALVYLVFAFWVLRNLPLWPFDQLAPHPLAPERQQQVNHE